MIPGEEDHSIPYYSQGLCREYLAVTDRSLIKSTLFWKTDIKTPLEPREAGRRLFGGRGREELMSALNR